MPPSMEIPLATRSDEPACFTPSPMGETPLLVAYSTRVKALDTHPTEPWVLCAKYDGSVVVHDLETTTVVKTFRVSTAPVRTAKFVARMNWVATGCDDHKIRVFHFDTNELVAEFEAHDDYVRGLDTHSTLPLLFSCGDDRLIKAWDWTKNWVCVRKFQGHGHYVMGLAVGGNTLATASLDHIVRLWEINCTTENDRDASATVAGSETLTAHERGINAIAINTSGSQLLTASDDRTVRVWDVPTKTVIAVLSGHTDNVTSVLFHPTLPLFVSGAEDNTVRLWDASTFRCVGVWSHGLGRAWALAVVHGRDALAIGYDRGSVAVTLPSSVVG